MKVKAGEEERLFVIDNEAMFRPIRMLTEAKVLYIQLHPILLPHLVVLVDSMPSQSRSFSAFGKS